MKYRLILVVLVLIFAGCQQSSSNTSKTADSISVSKAQNLVRFEVRDFKLDEEKNSYGGRSIKGRGTLVAKDDAIKKGNYAVWLSYKEAHNNDEQRKQVVVIRDGIGTIETYDYISSSEKEKTKIKYADWKIIGFVKLQEGIISLDEPVGANWLVKSYSTGSTIKE